jgi:hypothetical protein
MCYCEHCEKRFRKQTGKAIPRAHNWDDPLYRSWILWSYDRRLAIWDLNNRVTQQSGGPDCLWIGMNGGSITGQSRSFRDDAAICARAKILMLDHQGRSDTDGFENNADTGKRLHGLLGWDKLIPESMALYQTGRPTFRLASKPEPEARLWMLAGFAGGIQPWWHHIAAYHEDRRMYHTAGPILGWHKANESHLIDRRPIATVGVVWSQRNTDFFGREDPEGRVEQPRRGFTRALVRARILYLPVHVDQIEREAARFAVLILPNLGALSDKQAAAIRRFVEGGGGLIATGQTSLYDEWGDPRHDYALADIFGVRGGKPATLTDRGNRARDANHTYLRLTPELRVNVEGPKSGDEPAVSGIRHSALAGFEETDILPYGGTAGPLSIEPPAQSLLTFVPAFPIFPPETAWMRQPRTNIPGLVVSESRPGRVAFLPADIDHRFAIDNLPDHGNLLANLVRWAARGKMPLDVRGHGMIDCELYEQPGRLILHLVNLTSAGSGRAPVDELIPIGPLQVRIRVPQGVRPRTLKQLVKVGTRPVPMSEDWVEFEIDSVLDHEVVVLES